MIKETSQGLNWYSWEILNRQGLTAGTTCRSTETGENFNLALHTPLPHKDDKSRVLRNRKVLTEALNMDPGSFTAACQTHSCHSALLTVRERGRGAFTLEDSLPDTDALILSDPGLLGVIFTADCLPVILFDPEKRIAALIHAGWKGIGGGIVPSVLGRMEKELGCRKESLLAACGPAIGSCCYQVDLPVFRGISGRWPETLPAFRPDGKDHWRLSLEEAVRFQLLKAGVGGGNIETSGLCSCCHPDFFSWRGDGPDTGRIATFVKGPAQRPLLES